MHIFKDDRSVEKGRAAVLPRRLAPMKLVALLLISLIAAALAGCGGGDSVPSALDNRQVKCEEEILEELSVEDSENPAEAAEGVCKDRREEEEGKTPEWKQEAQEQREANEAAGTAPFTGCPEDLEVWESADESIAEGERSIEEGKEVRAARIRIKLAEEMQEVIEKRCGINKETARLAAQLCKNTPEQIAEALEIEDTPANREAVEAYEIACDEVVPIP